MHLKHDKNPNYEMTLFLFQPGRKIEFNRFYITVKQCQQNKSSHVARQIKKRERKKRQIYFHRIIHLVLRNPSGNVQYNPRRVSSQEQPSEEVLLD